MTAKNVKYVCCVGLASVVTLVSCTKNHPYRTTLPLAPGQSLDTNYDQRANEGQRAEAIETNDNYNLGFVELDDQGWFWAHKQWQAVKTAIQTEASNNSNGLVIVVFVHGWKNNAKYNDTNVVTFRGIVNSLGQIIAQKDKLNGFLPPRKVFGVYVGWRGLSTISDYFPPFAEELSFYNRKAAAERIGHEGAATQVFTELEVMRDQFNAKRDTNLPPSRLLIIGHSFGAALVYSAISEVLTERLVLTTNQKEKEKAPLKSLGDLVILLSPAFEASRYNNLFALASSPEIIDSCII